MTASSDLRVGICTIAKDEGSYLEEWVVYHHLQGYAPIRVYAHECSDNSHAVLARLTKYGLCEWEAFVSPRNRKPQWIAYEQGMEALRDRTDWIAFIDIDEFIVTPGHSNIHAFLAEYGQLGAIAINWKMFGSAGLARREPGLVIERFTRCASRDFTSNRSIKTLARTNLIEIPRVHTAHFAPGTVYQTVLGEPIAEHAGRSSRVDHDTIRINHYFTRSLEEWEHKAARGRGAKRADSSIKHRTQEEFDAQDRNEEVDKEILRWAQPIRSLAAELREADLDVVYLELDIARRRTRQLEAQVTNLRAERRAAISRANALLAALQAEIRRSELLTAQARVLTERLSAASDQLKRVAESASWRIGSNAVRVGRMAMMRRTEGRTALALSVQALVAPIPDQLQSEVISRSSPAEIPVGAVLDPAAALRSVRISRIANEMPLTDAAWTDDSVLAATSPGASLHDTVDLPAFAVIADEQYSAEYRALRERYSHYRVRRLFVMSVPACTLAGPHLVALHKGGFVHETIRGGKSFRDGTVFTSDDAGVRVAGSATTVTYDETVVAIGAAAASGYFHWMTEVLPRLQTILDREELRSLPIVMRPVSLPFQRQSLDWLGIAPRFVDEGLVCVPRAVIPSFPIDLQRGGRYSPELVTLSRAFRERYVPKRSGPSPARVYVSRRDAAKRKIANETELEEMLTAHGFTCLTLSDLPLDAQVHLFANAEIVVAQHGAGLTNILFARPGTRVIELYTRGFMAPSPFWTFAGLAGLDYSLVVCDLAAPSRGARGVANADIRVDVQRLERLLS